VNLAIWPSGMFVLGVPLMVLCVLFPDACEKVRRKPAEGFSRWNRTRTPPEKSRSTQCERDH